MAKILIIDDDLLLLKVMISLLEEEIHDISAATDGIQGIKLLEAQRFDLVITDVIMPEEDGLGILKWLLTQPVRPKVIAMSGGSAALDQSFILDMCRRLRADKILPKPVDVETLLNAVNEVLKGVRNMNVC